MKHLTILLSAILLLACNDAKKLQKAEARVMTDLPTFNRIGDKWAKLNPCSNDTTIISKSDTTYHTDTLTEKETVSVKGDTVYIVQPGKVITNTRTIRDTVRQVVVDNRALNMAKDTATKWQNAAVESYKVAMQAKQDADAAEDKADKWKWWFWIVLLAGVGSHIIRSKFKMLG